MSKRRDARRLFLPRSPRTSSLRDLSVTYEGQSEAVATHPRT